MRLDFLGYFACMNDPDGDQSGFELIMPFVVCKTNGGVYEDDSFCAGWALGKLEAAVSVAGALGMNSVSATLPIGCVAQVDLIAMHAGAQCLQLPFDESVDDDVAAQWASVLVTWEPIDS